MLLFFLLFTFSMQADSAQAFVPVSGYVKQQQYSIPFHHYQNNAMDRALRDHKYHEHQKMLKIDYEAHTKYYTDAVYRKKVDTFNQLIFKCNSINIFERILARYLILFYQLAGPHEFIVNKIKEELAQRYFDNAKNLINYDLDHFLGAVVDDFFRNVFNHKMYLKAHNILHDDASLEIISREKSGFLGRAFSAASSAIKSVPEYLARCFRSGCTVEQAVNNEYNKQIVKMIQLLQRGEFEQAKQLLAPGDQLMQEMWNQREIICLQSGGTPPANPEAVTTLEITQVQEVPAEDLKGSILEKTYQQELVHSRQEIPLDTLPQERLAVREEALKKAQENPCWTKVDYDFPTETKKLLLDHNVDPTRYNSCLGNQFQQIMHQECIHILNDSAKLYRSIQEFCKFLIPSIVSYVDLGREHNQFGFVKKAVLCISMSWALLSRGQQLEKDMSLGVCEGTIDVASNIYGALQDPGEAYNGIVKTAHTLADIGAKLIDAGLNTSKKTKEEQAAMWEKRWEKIALTATALKQKLSQTSVRELARFGTSVTLETILFEKAMGTLAKLFKQGAKELVSLARKVKEASRAVKAVATTAKGVSVETRVTKEVGEKLFNAIEGAGQKIKDGARAVKSTETAAKVLELVQEIEELLKPFKTEAMRIKELFHCTRKGFGEFSNKYIKVVCEHILRPEFVKTKRGLKLTGFHHDMKNLIEKSGLLKMKNKVFGKHGIYEAEVWFNGLKETKTYFPAHWSQEKVISKVYEAYDNFIAAGAKTFKITPDGKYLARGLTSEGIEVEMYIIRSGVIPSAYPIV